MTEYYKKIVDNVESNSVVQQNSNLYGSSEFWMFAASMMHTLERRKLFSKKFTPSVDTNPQPLLTMSFIDWFESYNFSDWNLLELGSGESTYYFKNKVKYLESYETDRKFYDRNVMFCKDITYNYIESDKLENKKFTGFDDKTIVVIDCACNRLNVTKNIISSGAKLIVLDNSDIYPNTCDLLHKNDYFEIPFWGFKKSEHFVSCTSVFLKDSSILPAKNLYYKSINSRKIEPNLWDM